MRLIVVVAALLMTAACSSGSAGPAQLVVAPTELAVESAPDDAGAAVDDPGQAAAPADPKPTKRPTFFTPKGWDGISDVDCKELVTHRQAVSFFRGTGGTKTDDPYGLDRDHDGNPCETLP